MNRVPNLVETQSGYWQLQPVRAYTVERKSDGRYIVRHWGNMIGDCGSIISATKIVATSLIGANGLDHCWK